MSRSLSTSANKKEEKQWANDWDAKKDILNIYQGKKGGLSKNYKLAVLGSKEREFIAELHSSAKFAHMLCPDKKTIAGEIYDMIMMTADDIAVLKFNVPGNMIVDRVVDYHKGEEEMEERKGMAGWFQKLSNKIVGEERLNVEKE